MKTGCSWRRRDDSVAPERVQACIKKLTTILFVNCTKMFFFLIKAECLPHPRHFDFFPYLYEKFKKISFVYKNLNFL